MASLASPKTSFHSFTARNSYATIRCSKSAITRVSTSPKGCIKASFKEIGVAIAATAASALLTSNALAIEILLGANDGSLNFVPQSFTVSPGEKIVFKNNAGFPHNVVFDEAEVPAGVDAASISMAEEDLLNAPGETYSVALTTKGSYGFYCAPHQGAGMVGVVTVN